MGEITCSVIIGHDLTLLRWCLENARARAGITHQWLVVNWIPAERPEVAGPIEAWCKVEGVQYCSFLGGARPAAPQESTAWFLRQLYACWNLTYSAAQTKWVARMGSDTFFSKNWLARLLEAADAKGDRAVYHTWTVESPVAKRSRHDIQDWGSTWQEFDLIRFEAYASERAWRWQNQLVIPGEESGLFYQHPTRGMQQRADAVTWLQTRALWDEFKPMKDHINEEGVSGDVDWFDRMADAGIKSYLVPAVTNFHLCRGESRSIQK